MERDYISEKLDKLDNRLDSIDKTLVRHDENLKNHLYRTELLEKQTERLFNELVPIQSHVNQLNGVLKFIGVISTLLGMIAAILKIAGLF